MDARVYFVHMVGPNAHVGEVVGPNSTSRWSVTFFVLPKKKRGSLNARIAVSEAVHGPNACYVRGHILTHDR